MKSPRLRFSFGGIGTLALLLMLSGCWGKRDAVLAPVEGKLTINGKPAANIMVQFLPVAGEGEPAPTSSGITNELGQFELATDTGKAGAVVGKCKILYIDLDEERVAQGQTPKAPRIPASFAVLSGRTEEVEVNEDSKPFELNIISN